MSGIHGADDCPAAHVGFLFLLYILRGRKWPLPFGDKSEGGALFICMYARAVSIPWQVFLRSAGEASHLVSGPAQGRHAGHLGRIADSCRS